MRSLRKALSVQDIERSAQALLDNLSACTEFQAAESIAAYLAMPGELDLERVIATAWQLGKQVYLPLVDGSSMHFVAYTDATSVRTGPFGIRQPHADVPISDPRQIDLILVPLVAFDHRGTRIGMGGGYYDRAFEFRRLGGPRRPLLAGVAYSFQQVEFLTAEKWDVPLDLVVTDTHIIRPPYSGTL